MQCPICQHEVDKPDGNVSRAFFPFCSDRCKLIDLGRWLGGKYQIPVVDMDESHDGVIEPDESPRNPR